MTAPTAIEWLRGKLGDKNDTKGTFVFGAAPVPGAPAAPGCGAAGRRCAAVLYYPLATVMVDGGADAYRKLDGYLRDDSVDRVLLAVDVASNDFRGVVRSFKLSFAEGGKTLDTYFGGLAPVGGVRNENAARLGAAVGDVGANGKFASGLLGAGVLGGSLGAGAFGTAHVVQVTDEVLSHMAAFAHGASYKVVQELPTGGEVILKVARLDTWLKLTAAKLVGERSRKEFIEDGVREASMHQRLSNGRLSGCTRIGPWNLCPSQVVPRFYFAGLIRDPAGREAYVTCMDRVPGRLMSKMSARQMKHPQVYVAVERAIAAMWSAGVMHGDLHLDNMMYRVEPGQKRVDVRIIDFGYAVSMPAGLRDLVRTRMSELAGTPASLATVWLPRGEGGLGLAQHLRTVLWERKQLEDVNDDGSLLLKLYHGLDGGPAGLAAIRQATRHPANAADEDASDDRAAKRRRANG